jgi:hypothetical protein
MDEFPKPPLNPMLVCAREREEIRQNIPAKTIRFMP